MSSKRALITGVTGQDGSYLAEFLLAKGYEVHGIVRRSSSINRDRIDHLTRWLGHQGGAVQLYYGDLNDSSSLNRIVRTVRPDEIYNLGAQSHVKVSFDVPEYTGEIDGLGTTRLLEAILESGLSPRFYQASSSEMFGQPQSSPQNERTPFSPRSPYAVAKLYAYWMTVNYRDAYGIHASNGILYNHESPRRGETFVSRKITRAVGRIAHGLQEVLYLGNLNARRDWGFAGDYVGGMWKILQQESPGDYVFATGKSHSVRDFCERAFLKAGFAIAWEGEGVDELGRDRRSGRTLIRIDKGYLRPTDVEDLRGDASKALAVLGWSPQVAFQDLVDMMVDADMELAAREARAAGLSRELQEQ